VKSWRDGRLWCLVRFGFELEAGVIALLKAGTWVLTERSRIVSGDDMRTPIVVMSDYIRTP
jgi:hypothetical protein